MLELALVIFLILILFIAAFIYMALGRCGSFPHMFMSVALAIMFIVLLIAIVAVGAACFLANELGAPAGIVVAVALVVLILVMIVAGYIAYSSRFLSGCKKCRTDEDVC